MPERGQPRPFERVDGDVDLRALAVADLLAVVEHRRLVLLALADDDARRPSTPCRAGAHRVDGGLVGGDLVAAPDPAPGGQRRRLRDADELEREVPVGQPWTGAATRRSYCGYIRSGASTPIRSSERAITACVACHERRAGRPAARSRGPGGRGRSDGSRPRAGSRRSESRAAPAARPPRATTSGNSTSRLIRSRSSGAGLRGACAEASASPAFRRIPAIRACAYWT